MRKEFLLFISFVVKLEVPSTPTEAHPLTIKPQPPPVKPKPPPVKPKPPPVKPKPPPVKPKPLLVRPQTQSEIVNDNFSTVAIEGMLTMLQCTKQCV